VFHTLSKCETINTQDELTVDWASVSFEGVRETRVDRKTGLPKRYEEDIDGDGDMG
jgi:hypothetical protein